MSDVDRDTRSAYATAAAAWARGPERVYRHLSAALLDAVPRALRGALLLDVGAGTGVLGDIATDRGARCVEADVAVTMLTQARTGRARQSVAADGRRLPFAGAAFDVATAACSLSHVADPGAMLSELHRVLRPGGVLAASAFPATGTSHPVRACVEQVLEEAGYRRAAWYRALADTGEARVDTTDALHALATSAGFSQVATRDVRVDTGIADAAALVDYRLGVAQHAEFMAMRGDDDRRRIRETAIARLGTAPPALVVHLLVMTGRA